WPCLGIAAIGWWLLSNPVQAQDTNAYLLLPPTKLEAFETNISTVIIKATVEIGNIPANAGRVSIRCKEMTDTSTGRREYGVAIELAPSRELRDIRLIDYDEIGPLLDA